MSVFELPGKTLTGEIE